MTLGLGKKLVVFTEVFYQYFTTSLRAEFFLVNYLGYGLLLRRGSTYLCSARHITFIYP